MAPRAEGGKGGKGRLTFRTPLPPLTPPSSFLLHPFPLQADDLIRNGVKSIFVGGTTGESLCMTLDERKFLLEEWVRVAGDRIQVIANIGCESIADTKARTSVHAFHSALACVVLRAALRCAAAPRCPVWERDPSPPPPQ
jgi:hypothetical protein